MVFTLALLCVGETELARYESLVEELGRTGERPGELIVAAPDIVRWVGRTSARLAASLHPAAGLAGALQSALLAASFQTILALDAAAPPPPAGILRALLADPRPARALACRAGAAARTLPGRFLRSSLGVLSRALLDGGRELADVLRALHCSSLTGS